ncbi:MAG: DNA translocase FtsK, partial [Turicibacter sp.]
SDGEIAKSVASIAQSSQELELDDVLSLLNEEEKAPSIFEALLSEDEAHQEQVSDLGIDDVLTLLQEEEKQTSLLDQILNHSQEQASLEETLSDEIEDEMFTEEDESEFFDDENFCDEVLEQVRIEEEEVEAIYYETPPLSLLKEPTHSETMDEEWIVNKMEILEQTFLDFGVKVRLTGEYTQGPTVTQIEIQPESGTKLNKITGLSDDLKLSLSVEELRIEPIPGKNTIGVEIPNPKRKMVFLKEILSKPEFILHESPLCIGLGQDVSGQPVYADISTMPHGLIAGQTGSGKSVCINTLLVSMLYKASPEDVRVMLVDPKRVELAPYNAIPHLITPVICDERKAAQGLKWAVDEMERRYELFATNGVRDIKSFNERRHEFEMSYAKLPYILIVIDELADLMMVSAQEVEDCIMRITQKARAAGIHLIVATQRPTVDVITGTIKSNIPSRIAFAVAQANDSRVILDETGAQNLLGQGDMLWSSSGSKVKRVQGAYISSDEIDAIVACVKQQGKPKYLISDEVFQKGSSSIQSDTDPLLYDAMNFIFDRGHATVSSLQTRLRIGFNRAARIIDTLEMNGWIGEPQGAQKQREIKISREEFEAMKDQTRF